MRAVGKWLLYLIDLFNDGADKALGYPPYKDSSARRNTNDN